MLKRIRHHSNLLLLGLAGLSLLQTEPAQAQEIYSTPEETIPNSYPKDYIFLQALHDQPTARSREDLAVGKLSYGFAFRHHLGAQWIVGVGYRVKPFIRRDGRSLSLLTLANSTERIFRLYHPLYFLIGSEWSYLFPTTRISLPTVKDAEYTNEVGLGVNASLWWFIQPRVPMEFRIQRWRGTKTNRLHGWESSMAVGYSF